MANNNAKKRTTPFPHAWESDQRTLDAVAKVRMQIDALDCTDDIERRDAIDRIVEDSFFSFAFDNANHAFVLLFLFKNWNVSMFTKKTLQSKTSFYNLCNLSQELPELEVILCVVFAMDVSAVIGDELLYLSGYANNRLLYIYKKVMISHRGSDLFFVDEVLKTYAAPSILPKSIKNMSRR